MNEEAKPEPLTIETLRLACRLDGTEEVLAGFVDKVNAHDALVAALLTIVRGDNLTSVSEGIAKRALLAAGEKP